MYYFQKCIGGRLVANTVDGSGAAVIKAYANSYTSGQVGVTIVNTSAQPVSCEIKVNNFRKGNRFYWYSLQGSNDNGEFSRKVIVNGFGPEGPAGVPKSYVTIKPFSADATGAIRVTIPTLGSVCMMIDKKQVLTFLTNACFL
jgi:hypothetical protein